MAEQEIDAKQIEAKVHDLKEAMERVRHAQAERDDVVVEMKQAARARLELLAQDLQPLMNQIPGDDERFDFALTDGETPRLWIDMTTHVRMGRDRRVYEFVKDTRLGRAILAATDERPRMARAVAEYVAERVLERERSLEGDWQAMKAWDFERNRERREPEPEPATREAASGWLHLFTFLLGAAAGAVALVAWAWFGDMPRF